MHHISALYLSIYTADVGEMIQTFDLQLVFRFYVFGNPPIYFVVS